MVDGSQKRTNRNVTGGQDERTKQKICHWLAFTNLSDLLWLAEHTRHEWVLFLRPSLGQARGQSSGCYLRLSLDSCLRWSLGGKKINTIIVKIKVRIKSSDVEELVTWGHTWNKIKCLQMHTATHRHLNLSLNNSKPELNTRQLFSCPYCSLSGSDFPLKILGK